MLYRMLFYRYFAVGALASTEKNFPALRMRITPHEGPGMTIRFRSKPILRPQRLNTLR